MQDISELARELPRLPKNVNVVIMEKQDCRGRFSQDLRVRRHHVEVWLRYLKANARDTPYASIVISNANLAALPIDGVPDDIPTITDENIVIEEQVRDPNNNDPISNIDLPAVNTSVYIPPVFLPTTNQAIDSILNASQGRELIVLLILLNSKYF